MEDFNQMATNFDTGRRIERAKAISNEIRLHISDGQAKSAMEYGCGTGLVGFQLINDLNSLIFVDSSPAMIEQVKEKLQCLNKSTNNAICQDFIVDTPLDIGIDYIFSSLVLHHIKDTEAILSCMYNMLNNNGHLLIVDINTDDGSFHVKYPGFDGHNGFNQPALVALATDIGFKNVSIKTFYHGNKIINSETKPYSLFILDAVKKTPGIYNQST